MRLGRQGEEEAARFLKENGYEILCANYRTRFGEIDIVAREKGALCFVEVKSRRSERLGAPEEAVSFRKQRHICRAALAYLQDKRPGDVDVRFDVVALKYAEDGTHRLELIRDAFEMETGYDV